MPSITEPAPPPSQPLTQGLHPDSNPEPGSRRRSPLWNRFTWLQLLVIGLATLPVVIIAAVVMVALAGLVSVNDMIEIALGAGEDPGVLVFGAMFLASPVQWLTGRSQVRVRKYLGIVFYLLAVSNGAMFAIERSVAEMLDEPLLITGTVALALATPLFLTSSRFSQRTLGMKNWRLLHRLTYVVAAALLAHTILVGEGGLTSLPLALGFVARIPAARLWLENRAANRNG